MKLGKYQEGGAIPPQTGAPQGGEDPTAVLIQGAKQAESQDCQVGLQVCQMLLELVGGGAPQGGAPEGAPAEPAPGEPVYRKGGRLVRRINQ